MVKQLYSRLSNVCHEFYRMYFPHEKIASTLDSHLRKHRCKNIVFIGGLVHVADILQKKGYTVTFVDYTDEMVREAKKVLAGATFVVSDMRELDLDEEFDAILLIGRILTYMYTDADVRKTLSAFRNSLKPGGIAIIDNYEESKIDKDAYFNGAVDVQDRSVAVRRISRMRKKQENPSLYAWDCVYEVTSNGQTASFEDNGHVLRAFTKEEVKNLAEDSGLEFLEHTPNFEEKSFMTI